MDRRTIGAILGLRCALGQNDIGAAAAREAAPGSAELGGSPSTGPPPKETQVAPESASTMSTFIDTIAPLETRRIVPSRRSVLGLSIGL